MAVAMLDSLVRVTTLEKLVLMTTLATLLLGVIPGELLTQLVPRDGKFSLHCLQSHLVLCRLNDERQLDGFGGDLLSVFATFSFVNCHSDDGLNWECGC